MIYDRMPPKIYQGKNMKEKLQNLIFKILLAFLLLSSLANAAKQDDEGRRSGFVLDLGIGSNYKFHAIGDSILRGVETSINLNVGYIFRDYVRIDMGVGFGYTPSRLIRAYPFGVQDSILYIPPKDMIAVSIPYGFKIGYNLSSFIKNWGHSIYINSGVQIQPYVFSSGVALMQQVAFLNSYIEIEGSKKFGDNFRLEYMASFGFLNAAISFVGADDVVVSKHTSGNDDTTGYSLGGYIGFRYYFGSRVNFFTRLNLGYFSIDADKYTGSVTTPANPTDSNIIPSITTSIRYPTSSVIYSGVIFGFGF